MLISLFKPWTFCLCVSFLFVSTPVHAYIGPGTGISAIGSFLALIAAVLLAILGFIWYPLKRIYRKFKKTSNKEEI